jgi:hypothetical protein
VGEEDGGDGAMTAAEKRFTGHSVLLLAGGWVVCDWVTVGCNRGGGYLPWALDEIRIVLLALAVIGCGLVALAFGRRFSNAKLPLRVIVTISVTLMWACSAYVLWRCYQLSVGSRDNLWFMYGWLLEIGAALVTFLLWRP